MTLLQDDFVEVTGTVVNAMFLAHIALDLNPLGLLAAHFEPPSGKNTYPGWRHRHFDAVIGAARPGDRVSGLIKRTGLSKNVPAAEQTPNLYQPRLLG